MKAVLKWLAIGFFALVVLGALVGGDDSTTETTPTKTAGVAVEPDAEPEPEPEAELEPEKTDGEYELDCAYELGEGTDDNPFADYRFTAGGTLNNTGNTNIRVRVTYKWKRLGSSAKTARKTYRVKEGQERDVNITVPASQLDISAHQNADGDCSAKATIVGTY